MQSKLLPLPPYQDSIATTGFPRKPRGDHSHQSKTSSSHGLPLLTQPLWHSTPDIEGGASFGARP